MIASKAADPPALALVASAPSPAAERSAVATSSRRAGFGPAWHCVLPIRQPMRAGAPSRDHTRVSPARLGDDGVRAKTAMRGIIQRPMKRCKI